MQNVLEKWWIRIDDLRKNSVSKHVAFMKASTEFANATLDRIFGEKILSVRTISVTACLSLISLHFVTVFYQNNHFTLRNEFRMLLVNYFDFTLKDAKELAYMTYLFVENYFDRLYPDVEEHMSYLNMSSLPAIAAVLLPVVYKKLYWIPALVAALLAIFAIYHSHFHWYHEVSPSLVFVRPEYMTLITVIIGVIFDIIAISSIRILLRWQADWNSFIKTSFSALFQLVMSITLIILPMVLGTYGALDDKFSNTIWGNLVKCIFLSSATNILGALTTLTFFGAGIVLVIHWVIWPFIVRPLYQIAIHIRTPKIKTFSFALGVTLIAIGLGKGSDISTFLLGIIGVK